jgi:hypothetical protein
MKPSPLYNSLVLEGGLIGRTAYDNDKPLMSAEVVVDNKDFPEVDHFWWVKEYCRGELPMFCYEN